MPERKRKSTNWGQMIGWLIFVLAIAGGPILRGLQSLLGGAIQLSNLLPYLIGGLVLLSLAVSAVRALGRAGDAVPRLPDRAGSPGTPLPPMPPFGGEYSGMPQLPSAYLDAVRAAPPRPDAGAHVRPPRFDPIASPLVLAVGFVGLLVLGGAALLLLGAPLP
jgi:hypothetical protein